MSWFHNDILDNAITGVTGTTYWLAMHTGDPGGLAGNNEGTAVSRVEVDTAGWDVIANHGTSGRVSEHGEVVDFGTASGSETYTHAALWTAEIGGAVHATAELVEPVTVQNGSALTVPVGNLRMRALGVA